MRKEDRVRLLHMLDASKEVISFTRGKSRDSLYKDVMLVRALMMSIGIIGEAASRVSAEYRKAHPQVPWPQVIGMRNRLVHAYFDVDLDRLWKTATEDVPSLIPTLEKLLSEPDE